MEGDLVFICTPICTENFNPLPPHGGRLAAIDFPGEGVNISIHSLRMEGDVADGRALHTLDISIHSLRMEGDRFKPAELFGKLAFQSTPSAWRETTLHLTGYLATIISIHSLRMEGDADCVIIESQSRTFQSTPSAWRETHCVLFWNADRKISIHSLRMEGDVVKNSNVQALEDFNPLPPHGGRPN